jgi:hypothetical protein
MSSQNFNVGSPAHEEHKIRLHDNLRGIVIMMLGAAGLVGLAFGAMVMLTSPDGWVTKAANSAISSEPAQPTSLGPQEASN